MMLIFKKYGCCKGIKRVGWHHKWKRVFLWHLTIVSMEEADEMGPGMGSYMVGVTQMILEC
jgi:hypothetical protein